MMTTNCWALKTCCLRPMPDPTRFMPAACFSMNSNPRSPSFREQREVFIAHELEGRSFKQIAGETGVGVNTLLSRKRYAVLHLRGGCKAFTTNSPKEK